MLLPRLLPLMATMMMMMAVVLLRVAQLQMTPHEWEEKREEQPQGTAAVTSSSSLIVHSRLGPHRVGACFFWPFQALLPLPSPAKSTTRGRAPQDGHLSVISYPLPSLSFVSKIP